MNIILGIDYGRKKMGLAIADSDAKLADPFTVLHYSSTEEMFTKLGKIINSMQLATIVVGVSENQMAIEIKNFVKALEQQTKIKIEEFDETLTSHDANLLAKEAGIKRTKRKSMEDAYAAALMLQGYLDNNP